MIDDQALGEAVNDRNADVCRSVNRLKVYKTTRCCVPSVMGHCKHANTYFIVSAYYKSLSDNCCLMLHLQDSLHWLRHVLLLFRYNRNAIIII